MLNTFWLGNNIDVITFNAFLSDTTVLELLFASTETALIALEFSVVWIREKPFRKL